MGKEEEKEEEKKCRETKHRNRVSFYGDQIQAVNDSISSFYWAKSSFNVNNIESEL